MPYSAYILVALLVASSLFGCSGSSADLRYENTVNAITNGSTRFDLIFDPGVIATQCRAGKTIGKTEVGDLLDQLQNDYETKEARINNPGKFVEAIDSVIAKTKLAPILGCRDKLNATPGFSYALKFQDPALGNLSMQVTTDETGKGADKKFKKTLEFNLIKSPEKVIFIYLHELTHICQAPEFERLYAAYETDPENAERAGDVFRIRILDEIEAFYTMNLAYTELVKFSSDLCQATDSLPGQLSVSDGYIESENALLDGSFAQTIVYGYNDSFKGHEEHVLDLKSSSKDYKTAQLPEGKFSLERLNSKLRSQIQSLGIFVRE